MIGHEFPYLDTRDLNLDWLLKNMKQLLQDWATYQQTMNQNFADLQAAVNQFETDITTAFNNLHDYVEDYFDNLDVQEEINNKLEAMRQSGELAEIINPLISTATGNWLATHITNPSNPPIDTSLTVSNAAADAKVTGDTIRDALNTEIFNGDRLFNPTWIFQAYNPTTGQKISDPNQTQISTQFIHVGTGSHIVYHVNSGYFAFVMFYDNIDVTAFDSAIGAKTNGTYTATAPADWAIFILVNTSYSTITLAEASNLSIWAEDLISNNFGIIYMGNPNSDQPVLVDTLAKTIVFSDGTHHPGLLYQGKRIPVHGTLDIEELINNYGHIYYCIESETFYTTSAGLNDFNDMPHDAVYIGSIWSGGTCINLNVYPFYMVNGVKTTTPDFKFLDVPWSVRIAVLGDSISTFVGYSEDSEGGTAFIEEYYPRGNVDDVSKTWWEIVRKGLRSRFTPAVSAVSRSSYRYQDNPLIPYGGDDDRITRLGMYGTPNYIFIELGTNDGFYNNYGDNPYQTDINNLEQLKGTIYGGISTTINKVQNAYPSSKVYVLLPKFVSISAVHNPTYTFENYCKICDAITEIAREFGCKIIDLRKSAINYRNVLSYTIDGIHPSAGGMAKLAEYILGEILGEK